jgi:hypothetical protein
MTKHGVKDATVDTNQIREWWRKEPNANIGLACGEISGVHVVDLDVKADGNGWDTLKRMAEYSQVMPETIRQETPRGGAHFLFKTDDPPPNKNNFEPGIDIRSNGYYIVVAPSIHPNGGQYKWATGFAPWEHGLADFPDFFRAKKVEPKWSKEDCVPVPYETATSQDVIERARAYLAKCDPAVQGMRGHNKLLWAAICMVHGFQLSDGQAFSLLAHEYNPRCDPPWDLGVAKDKKDFERKIHEARKIKPTNPPGWLLADDAYREPNMEEIMERIDLESILENKGPKVDVVDHSVGSQSLLDSEINYITKPTGLLGEMVSWINSTAMVRQPMFALGASLAFCGALFGRKVRDESGLRTNVYCMGLGDSSSGKQHNIDKILDLMTYSGSLEGLLAGTGFGSDTGLEEIVTIKPACIFLLDEIGHLFMQLKAKQSQYLVNVVPTLMRMYSSAKNVFTGKVYGNMEKQRTIIQPCLNFWGTSDEERFQEGCTPSELKDGWLSRCMVFRAHNTPDKQRGIIQSPPPPSLINQVSAWFNRVIPPEESQQNLESYARMASFNAVAVPPSQLVIHTKREADNMFCEFDQEAKENGRNSPKFAGLWSKAEENARKFALIGATSESYDRPLITPAVADMNIRLVRCLLSDFMFLAGDIAENAYDSIKIRLRKIIGNFGIMGCSGGMLCRKSQFVKTVSDRNALLGDLVEAGLIIKQATTRGFQYWTPDNYVIWKDTGGGEV